MSRYIRGQVDRLRAQIGPPPEDPKAGVARERMRRVLDTVHSLILEHGDEIDRDYKERIARGEDHKAALVTAKRDALGKTREGAEAWAVLDAVLERRGRG
jgi:hypothetical protein